MVNCLLCLAAICLVSFGVRATQQCTTCHQEIHDGWAKSDHANAMAVASRSTVLADFNNQRMSHNDQKARFYLDNNQYKVAISSVDNKSQHYSIKYTVGHFPLQQYLVETEPGRLQVLPFSWDARENSAGGQRWYPSNPQTHKRLHWTQPLQNFNGMCADCHMDGLKRNYNAKTNRFAMTWDAINVGCLSCHDGKTEPHGNAEQPTGHWLRLAQDDTAHWKGPQRDNRFMDGCFGCHSLRTPLSDGFDSKQPFLDQFTPQLLPSNMYHADGQIDQEVYVYGSFLQSKMFAAGVNCTDCHDSHSYKLKVQGNGLCLQCHSAQSFDVEQHHRHPKNSEGALCVNCHMPQNRYMGVDDRRDHSFKIPRPDVSAIFDTPNACNQCHGDKSIAWATRQLQQWHGEPESIRTSKQLLMAFNSGHTIGIENHWLIVNDDKLDVISRANALMSIGQYGNTVNAEHIKPYVTHVEPLLRLASPRALAGLPTTTRVRLLRPLLTDEYKAIRVVAAKGLIGSEVLTAEKPAFAQAFEALQTANNTNSWRAEGRIEQGVTAASKNWPSQAEQAFFAAIKIDPFMEAAYTNLAQWYRAQQRFDQEAATLQKGIVKLPKSGSLRFAYGLQLVRQQQLPIALIHFEQAAILVPNNAQYAYSYLLALDGLGRTKEALATLNLWLPKYTDNAQLKALRSKLIKTP